MKNKQLKVKRLTNKQILDATNQFVNGNLTAGRFLEFLRCKDVEGLSDEDQLEELNG